MQSPYSVHSQTGVGKSSLINHAFGVDEAVKLLILFLLSILTRSRQNESEHRPGHANVDTEILSPLNPHFVLHDSKGFEPGEVNNVQIVQQFIQERIQRPNLKDKLHAIWYILLSFKSFR
jgi:predicted GTPase